MRRTQQNADPQRRRGIRSRLVACVAAVAMLVTSVAAGTAVATELGNNQTPQDTATVEQLQRATGHEPDATAGDQADQNAADAQQAADGADDAQNNNNDATAQSETSADGESAPSAVNTVVPQSTDSNTASVQPRSTSKTLSEEDRPSTSNKVKVYAFDYSDSINNNGHTLQFNGGDGAGINKYQNDVRQGIVDSQLDDNGYPKLSGNGQSLDYLFNTDSVDGKTSYTNNGNGLDGLFTFDENTGYYEYDSAKNYATLVNNDGQPNGNVSEFRVYDQGRFESSWDPTKAFGYGAFLPFNDLETDGQNYFNDEYRKDSFDGDSMNGFGGTNGYLLDNQNPSCRTEQQYVGWWPFGQYETRTICSPSDDQYANYHFGMSVGAEFYMPEDRKVNGENMVFEFGGDDDVWVFLDGHLVMDLGGIHDYRTGSINFTEGTVSVQNMDDVKLDDLYGSDDWSDDSTTHELKVFYLERGKGGSNCKFRFNLPAISSDQIQIAKTVVGDADPDGYTFNAYVSNSGTTEPALYTGTYVVRTVGQPAGGVEQTAENGAIVLKAGEYATLTNPDITVNATYYVVERDASEYTVTASGGSGQQIKVTSDAGTGSATTGVVNVRDVPFMTVKNTKPTQPGIRKWITKDEGSNDEYTLQLSATGKTTTSSEDTSVKRPVDVVFVLDKSTSMDERIDGGQSPTKLQAMKSAATQLVGTILGNENIDARIGVIKFSGSAEKVLLGGLKWSNDAGNVTGAINQISMPDWGDGTDWTEALKYVSEYSDTRTGATRYLIFLTDGEPQSDSGTRNDNYTTAGTNLARDGWNIMNIGVGLDRNNSLDDLNSAEYNEVSDHETQHVQLFESDDQESLNEAFESIGQIIESTETVISQGNIVIIDNISEWAEAVGITAPTGTVKDGVTVKSSVRGEITGQATITLSGKVLTVSLPASYTLTDGETITVSFKVKPSTLAYETYAANLMANGSADENTLYVHNGTTDTGGANTGGTSTDKPGFFSNTSATLQYKECMASEGEQSTCGDDPKTMTYNKPVLQVKSTTMSVQKNWNDGNSNHSGVTVELVKDGNDTGRTLALNADNNWQGSFVGLIPSHMYTVQEVSVPGYSSEVAYSKNGATVESGLNVNVSDVWQQKQSVLSAIITNTPMTASTSVDIVKMLDGRNWNDDDSFTFCLEPENNAPLPINANDEGCINLSGQSESHPGYEGSRSATLLFTLTYPGQDTFYTYTVTEQQGTVEGIVYSQASYRLKVSVKYSNGNVVASVEDVEQLTDDDGNNSESGIDTNELLRDVLFTNRFVSVSSLPLTGGDSTARTLLLAGGGVLLVAGAAWLLARRRRV